MFRAWVLDLQPKYTEVGEEKGIDVSTRNNSIIIKTVVSTPCILGTIRVFLHVNITSSPQVKCRHDCSHFGDEKVEAQGGNSASGQPGFQSRSVRSPGGASGSRHRAAHLILPHPLSHSQSQVQQRRSRCFFLQHASLGVGRAAGSHIWIPFWGCELGRLPLREKG